MLTSFGERPRPVRVPSRYRAIAQPAPALFSTRVSLRRGRPAPAHGPLHRPCRTQGLSGPPRTTPALVLVSTLLSRSWRPRCEPPRPRQCRRTLPGTHGHGTPARARGPTPEAPMSGLREGRRPSLLPRKSLTKKWQRCERPWGSPSANERYDERMSCARASVWAGLGVGVRVPPAGCSPLIHRSSCRSRNCVVPPSL